MMMNRNKRGVALDLKTAGGGGCWRACSTTPTW